MKLKRKHLLYFGPLTIAIEWTALLIGSFYVKNFDFNNAISTLTNVQAPLSGIFAITLLLAGITYSIFCFSLKQYSKKIPVLGTISGILFALTGVIVYTGSGGISDVVHNLVITTSVIGYSCIIYLMKDHPVGAVQKASKLLFKVFILGIILATIALYFIDLYIALTQLFILFIIQVWTIIIVWHDLKLE